MSKLGKSKTRKKVVRSPVDSSLEPKGPHDWFYGPSAAIEKAGLTEAANNIVSWMNMTTVLSGAKVTKCGPGVVVIRHLEDHEIGGPSPKDEILTVIAPGVTLDANATYQRMALVGDEKMTVNDVYFGKRDGVIVRLAVEAGVILGFDKPCLCEVPLKALVTSFVPSELGRPLKERVDEYLSNYSDDPADLVSNLASAKERLEEAARKRAQEEREEYVRKRQEDYGSSGWGAW